MAPEPAAATGIGGLVLAAGAGTRFGGPKQLADLDGRPLLQHALRALTTAPVDRVVVVLGAAADAVLAGVDLRGAEPVVCERWREGLSASLACGLAELEDCDAVVVALGDQPRLSPEAVARVLGARGRGADAVRATYDGAPGHPVLLERTLFERARHLGSDRGAASLLADVATRTVPCDDLGGGQDVDTRAQLDALRRAEP